MGHQNDRARKHARSSKSECKHGKFNTSGHAQAWLDRLAKSEPLKALGMRTYECSKCGFYHVGRAPTR